MSHVSPNAVAPGAPPQTVDRAGGGTRHPEARRRPVRSGARREMRASATGMRFDALLAFESWTALGSRIGAHANASSWWLGDWLLFGRMKYGRRYKEAVAATGLDHQTLRNYASVARRFDPARRREDLTFQHHAEVASMTDEVQDSWLEQAAAGGWSKQELRRRIRASRGLMAAPTLRIAVDAERERRWRTAADRNQCPLELWIPQVLDAACDSVA